MEVASALDGLIISDFTARDFAGLLAEFQRMVCSWQDGAVRRIGADFAPGSCLLLGNIFHFQDCLGIFVAVFGGSDQAQGKPVRIGKGFAVHAMH